MDRIKAFINGHFQTSDGEVLIKINPVSGAPIAEVEKTDTALLEQAITAAKKRADRMVFSYRSGARSHNDACSKDAGKFS